MNLALPEYSSPVGAILWDVENFPFKLDLAKHLKAHCQYPVTIKFAVANWLNSGVAKLDKHLHQQGYQLIHVPQGKNAADGQLLTLGGSLQLNYPQLKEVTIVSHDSIFNYLHQTLQRQGLNTYKVYHHSGSIYIDNFISDRPSIITQLATPTQESTIEHEIQTRIERVLTELGKTQTKVSLSVLSQEFKVRYQKSLNEMLKHNKLAKSTSFIKQNCSQRISLSHSEGTHYVSLVK